MHFSNSSVITGSPCSGKTSITEIIEQLGFSVVPEAARKVIEGRIQQGETTDEIFTNQRRLNQDVMEMYEQMYTSLNPKDPLFHDRGFHDTGGYANALMADDKNMTDEIRARSAAYVYRRVFFCEPIAQYELDGERLEQAGKIVESISRELRAHYRQLNYDVVILGNELSATQRTHVVLEKSKKSGIPIREVNLQKQFVICHADLKWCQNDLTPKAKKAAEAIVNKKDHSEQDRKIWRKIVIDRMVFPEI